jgi:hypothetical protein
MQQKAKTKYNQKQTKQTKKQNKEKPNKYIPLSRAHKH